MNLLNDVSAKIANLAPSSINNLLSNPFIIFPCIVALQGTQGGRGVVLVPQCIKDLANNPVTRLFLLTCVAFVATKNIALALVGAIAFALLMFLLRNDEERDAAPLF